MEQPDSLGGSDTVGSEVVGAEGGVGQGVESQGALSQVGVDGAPQLGRLQEQREESQHGLVGWTDREQLRDRERERERERERDNS